MEDTGKITNATQVIKTTQSYSQRQWYYDYVGLDNTRDSFRIIKLLPGPYSASIKCILSHDRVSTLENGYSALLYTWGKKATQRWIRVNGKPFIVQPSLFQSLKSIRREDKEIYIWADAICINQQDTKERNYQVCLMRKIYQGAKDVRV
jgi:hypothetical protein